MHNSLDSRTKSLNTLIYNVKMSVLFVFLMIVCLFRCTESTDINYEKEIITVKKYMQEQEESWNKGDLEGFMKHYWKSDSLRFIGKSGMNYGWEKTLENYKKSYQNKEEMGTLKFTNKTLDFVGEQTIFVVGEWLLSRKDSLGDLSGMYSLIWEKKDKKWVITTDHSS